MASIIEYEIRNDHLRIKTLAYFFHLLHTIVFLSLQCKNIDPYSRMQRQEHNGMQADA